MRTRDALLLAVVVVAAFVCGAAAEITSENAAVGQQPAIEIDRGKKLAVAEYIGNRRKYYFGVAYRLSTPQEKVLLERCFTQLKQGDKISGSDYEDAARILNHKVYESVEPYNMATNVDWSDLPERRKLLDDEKSALRKENIPDYEKLSDDYTKASSRDEQLLLIYDYETAVIKPAPETSH